MNKTPKPTPVNTAPGAASGTLPVFLATMSVAAFAALCSPQAQAQVTTSAPTTTSEGVVLINQDRALAGMGSGDSAGFPINLLRSGSYKLTSNLVVPAGLDAIQVADAISVVIDLNGFQIVGAAACSATLACQSNSGTAGVRAMGTSSFATVRNGRLRGFSYAALGGATLWTGRMALHDLVLEQNGYGARLSVMQAHRVLAQDNHATGLSATTLTVNECQAIANAGHGFAGVYGTVRASTALNNHDYGFQTPSVLLQGNAAFGNKLGAYYGGVVAPAANTF